MHGVFCDAFIFMMYSRLPISIGCHLMYFELFRHYIWNVL